MGLKSEKKYVFSVDSNQMLSFDNACKIMKLLDENYCLWLEEPFAPDNIQLHQALKKHYSENNSIFISNRNVQDKSGQ